MNNLRNKKSVNETEALPPILSDTTVFTEMTRAERTDFYAEVNKMISSIDKKLIKTQDLYKAMCLYPEKRLVQAFLHNKFKDEKKFYFYVNVLQHCLYSHLSNSIDTFQKRHETIAIEMNKAELRITQMKKQINNYSPKIECYA